MTLLLLHKSELKHHDKHWLTTRSFPFAFPITIEGMEPLSRQGSFKSTEIVLLQETAAPGYKCLHYFLPHPLKSRSSLSINWLLRTELKSLRWDPVNFRTCELSIKKKSALSTCRVPPVILMHHLLAHFSNKTYHFTCDLSQRKWGKEDVLYILENENSDCWDFFSGLPWSQKSLYPNMEFNSTTWKV